MRSSCLAFALLVAACSSKETAPDDITWLTSGGGGGALGKINENATRPECASRMSSGAFWNATVITVKPNELTGTTYDDKGGSRDTFTRTVP